MNYLIWKDIDSTSIKGLIISELPPITKPRMRVQETEVDGVDGSIIEELGYESYDKQVLIGLSFNYDIDEVIKYFTGEGNIVFSNEPNKYYKAKIIEQIDYERLLRFKTATVKFRVQPFKYEYQEEKSILEAENITGKSITYTKEPNTQVVKLGVEGNSIQSKTPTPNAPIKIESIGDERSIEIEVKKGTTTTKTTLTLDEPLRSLPNGVKDIAYIKGNKLYVDRYIRSVVLDGSENWSTYASYNTSGGTGYCYLLTDDTFAMGYLTSMCSHFKNVDGAYLPNVGYIGAYSDHATRERKYFVSDKNTLDAFKTWLSENQVELIYELSTPITEEFEISSLIVSEGTNIISNSENANMIVSYIDDKLIVNNIGNYIAKPVMTIKGSETIEFILNGNKLFSYTFQNGEDTVVIDSEKQDAYLESVLKNRNMSGEFPKFEIGENIITWTGAILRIEISSKSRWL